MAANGNGKARVVQFVAAIVGTVLISLLGAWFTFGQEQSQQLVRLEAQETESARQRQIDLATVQALDEAIRVVQARLAEIETRLTVIETRLALEPSP